MDHEKNRRQRSTITDRLPDFAAVVPPFSLAEEPCRWIDDKHCHQALTADPQAYLDSLQADLIALAEGRLSASLPAKLLFADQVEAVGSDAETPWSGDFRVMPCVVRGADRVTKTVKVVGSNFCRRQVPGRMTVGRALCLDPVENHVAWEFAAFALSSARTGAVAALAYRALTDTRQRTLTLFGCGAVGWYSAFYIAADGRIDTLRLVDPDTTRRDACARSLQAALPQLDVVAATVGGIGDSDVVVAATDSRQAFLHPANSRSQLVISLGADADTQSELAPEWAQQADLRVDHIDSALIGDLKRWQVAGLIDAGQCPDLCTLLASGRPAGDRRQVFVSTGSALLDNLSIHYLLQTSICRG